MRLTNLYQLLLSIFFLSACTAIDKEETVPSYIYIDKISLSVNPDGSQGSNAHDIKDAWILANGELIGVFELPCRVPILKKDSVEIIVFGGIKVNGQNNNRKFYPFYDIYKKTIFMEPAVIDSISPVLTYKSSTKFHWVEDFEDFSISLEKTGITRTIDTLTITNLPSEVFEFNKPGNRYSGKVNFRSKKGTFENSSIEIFDLPRSTSDIYLEVNYKSDVAVQFGLYPTSGTTIDFGIPVYFTFPNPSEWKKAYIRMSDDVNSAENTGKKFRIFINAVNNEDKSAVILIDNLKLLHF
jgi:hypothetical protein